MFEVKTNSVTETESLGEKFAKILKGNEVIALYGGLGVGKTSFVRGLANGLDISDHISSPTFSLVNEYNAKNFIVYHFDMYRVNSWDSLYSTGFFDYLDNGVLIIEWSENIEFALPDNTIKIEIKKCDDKNDNIRIICFNIDKDLLK